MYGNRGLFRHNHADNLSKVIFDRMVASFAAAGDLRFPNRTRG